MSVSLDKGLEGLYANAPVPESTLHIRRIAKGGRRLSWTDRTLLHGNNQDGLYDVLATVRVAPRYSYDYDYERGSWGVWDREERRFAGHAGTQTGVRVMTRRMNQENQ